ncbi:hypothetical protein C5167_030730 [Papaver somniferum]|uniref:uncharacterized protein LOC113334893 isoform X2 n=1 Tax=Papaver somniferum TaxID=3469 RepID=UPI000E6F6258|nr:uncharacterized protein LOC113334893 isoform X2 [Papaver somniferum]RZC89037.1 hypothetical protein C5167_030730 [Papaver somniferum]
MESSVISPEDVTESLMNDGTIDAMRMKIITRLKANEELKNNTLEMVGKSEVPNTPGAEKKTKRELFDALRQELEAPVLEEASKSVWELIMDDNGLGKEITETVQKVFCRLSGREPPLYPPPENEKEKEDLEKENENVTSLKTKKKKKRSFSDMKGKGGLINGGGGSPAIPGASVLQSRKKFNERENYMESGARRCSRTDGKSWQCFKMAVPDQKYCENHMSRRNKQLKKNAETTTSATKKTMKSKKRAKATSVAISKSSADIKESNAGTASMLPSEVPRSQKKSKENENGLEPVTRRCKITDGKNWQCYETAAPDRKYCQKHLSRGTRVKKPAETTPSATKKSIKSKKRVKAAPLATAKSSVHIEQLNTDTISMHPNDGNDDVSPVLNSSPKITCLSTTPIEQNPEYGNVEL